RRSRPALLPRPFSPPLPLGATPPPPLYPLSLHDALPISFFPACASPIPRFAQVVVLPTPPFWLAMAMICVFNDFTSFLIGVVMCLHSSPGNDKSRHLKQVTASPKSNILLCLKSKGFEFLSAICRLRSQTDYCAIFDGQPKT